MSFQENSVHVHSGEEEVELQRNTKKVKQNLSFVGGQSFNDKLCGEIPRAYSQAFDFSSDYTNEDIMFDDEIKDLVEGITAIKVFKERKAKIRSQWTNAIIVKVFGRSVGFRFLQTRLSSLWKAGGRFDMVDLEKGFLLIRYGLKEDLEGVIYGGPWFIGEHFPSIRPWSHNFKHFQTGLDRARNPCPRQGKIL